MGLSSSDRVGCLFTPKSGCALLSPELQTAPHKMPSAVAASGLSRWCQG